VRPLDVESRPSLQRLAELFADVIEATPDRREEVLATLTPSDRSAVEVLLGSAASAEQMLESPQWDLAEEPGGEAASISLPPGTRAGRFTVVGEIGHGGMGVVYRARQAEPDREVALKVLAMPFPTQDAVRRFRREAAALARLRHEGVATIHESGTIENAGGSVPFFAMELVEGVPITESLLVNKSCGLNGRVELLVQVCEAVEHAHQKGVIHRDLKPGNVLVDRNGRARVLDFGIARLIDAEGEATGATQDAGRLVGTPAYMSPEQIRGGDIDTRSDVFALGVLAFEVLTDAYPHRERPRGLPQAAALWTAGTPRLASCLCKDLPRDFDAVLLKAMAHDPKDRYQGAAAFGRDLQRAANGHAVDARVPTALYRLSRLVRRHRLATALAGMVALAITVGVPSVAWQAVRAMRAEARAVRRLDDLSQLARALTDLNHVLSPHSGTMAGREILLGRVAPLFDRLAADPEISDELKADIAAGYVEVARMQGQPGTANRGELEQSARTYEHAISLLEEVYRGTRSPPGSWAPLATARMEASAVYHMRGERAGEAAHLTRAIDIAESATRATPDDIRTWNILADLLNLKAALVAQCGSDADKSEHLAAVVRLAKRLADLPCDSAEAGTLGGAMMALGRATMTLGDWHLAMIALDRGETLLTQRLNASPSDRWSRLTLGDIYRFRAQAMVQGASPPHIFVESLERAAEQYRIAMDLDPSKADAIQILAQSLLMLSEGRILAGQHSRAVEDAGEAVQIVERLLRMDPSDHRLRAINITYLAETACIFRDAAADPTSPPSLCQQRLDAARSSAMRASTLAESNQDSPLSSEMLEQMCAIINGHNSTSDSLQADPSPP
jgi:tetratricopeptide (TPR) repeat protein